MKLIGDKRFKMFLLIFMLAFISIVPLMSNLLIDSKNIVEVESQDSWLQTISGNKLEQDIILQGKLKNIGVYFVINSIANEEEYISVTIEQADKSITENVLVSDIISEDYNYIKFKLSEFEEGTAKLILNGENLSEGTDVNCIISKTLISGLPSAFVDSKECGGPIILKYEIFKYNMYFYYIIVLLSILVLTVVFTAFIIVYKKSWLDKYNILYICSFSIIFLVISINNPIASFLGEPISEAAYEFWYKAHEFGLLKSMMILMSGEALAWLERIFIFTADKLSNSNKYVFTIAQLMELTFIAGVISMFCLKSFKRFFRDEIRLIFTVFTGTMIFFPKLYYFYCTSYWGIFFIIAFALMEFDKLKKGQYIAGLILTIIICVSRIYYVVLIPITIFLLLCTWKNSRIRTKLYFFTVLIASTFEGVASISIGRANLENTNFVDGIKNMGIVRILENTLYYQVQIMNSFFSHQENTNGLVSNLFFLILFIGIIIAFVYTLISKKYDNKIPCFVGALGMLSFGTIMMNVITTGSYEQVAFPINYSKKVDWTTNYYQIADHHFINAYIVICILIMLVMYLVKEKINKEIEINKMIKAIEIGSLYIFVLLLVVQFAPVKVSAKIAPTEWKKIYGITQNESYYASINVDYGVAPISLQHNSECVLFAYDSAGNFVQWDNSRRDAYDTTKVYHTQLIGDAGNIEDRELLTLTVHKAMSNFETKYVAAFYDRQGNELARVAQANSTDRVWVDFIPDKPLENVYSIAFFLEDGREAYVSNALQIGVSAFAETGYLHCSLETYNNISILGEDIIHINSDSSVIVLKGWAADMMNYEPLSEIYMKYGDEIINGTYGVERQDVVDTLENENLRYVGFSFEIPVETLQNSGEDTMKLVLVGKDSRSKKIYNYGWNN